MVANRSPLPRGGVPFSTQPALRLARQFSVPATTDAGRHLVVAPTLPTVASVETSRRPAALSVVGAIASKIHSPSPAEALAGTGLADAATYLREVEYRQWAGILTGGDQDGTLLVAQEKLLRTLAVLFPDEYASASDLAQRLGVPFVVKGLVEEAIGRRLNLTVEEARDFRFNLEKLLEKLDPQTALRDLARIGAALEELSQKSLVEGSGTISKREVLKLLLAKKELFWAISRGTEFPIDSLCLFISRYREIAAALAFWQERLAILSSHRHGDSQPVQKKTYFELKDLLLEAALRSEDFPRWRARLDDWKGKLGGESENPFSHLAKLREMILGEAASPAHPSAAPSLPVSEELVGMLLDFDEIRLKQLVYLSVDDDAIVARAIASSIRSLKGRKQFFQMLAEQGGIDDAFLDAIVREKPALRLKIASLRERANREAPALPGERPPSKLSARRGLAEFLFTRFSILEVRQWMDQDYPELFAKEDPLAEASRNKAQVFVRFIARILMRLEIQGRIDLRFFDLLSAKKPYQRGEIAALRRPWMPDDARGSVEHSDPALPSENEILAWTFNPVTQQSIEDRLVHYLLNLNHKDGVGKAVWFQQALGFHLENRDQLARQLIFDPRAAKVIQVNVYGTRYLQSIALCGANGNTIGVDFVWLRSPEGHLRLITGLPTKQKEKPSFPGASRKPLTTAEIFRNPALLWGIDAEELEKALLGQGWERSVYQGNSQARKYVLNTPPRPQQHRRQLRRRIPRGGPRRVQAPLL